MTRTQSHDDLIPTALYPRAGVCPLRTPMAGDCYRLEPYLRCVKTTSCAGAGGAMQKGRLLDICDSCADDRGNGCVGVDGAVIYPTGNDAVPFACTAVEEETSGRYGVWIKVIPALRI